MSRNRKPNVVAGGIAVLLLAGCAGSFMPSTVGRDEASQTAASYAKIDAAPGSVGAHPTATSTARGMTEDSVGAHPTDPTSDNGSPSPTATPARKQADSVGPHPTGANDDATPAPAATPRPAQSSARKRRKTVSPNSVGAHPTGTGKETAAPQATSPAN